MEKSVQNKKDPELTSAEKRVKTLPRLLRSATALRVTLSSAADQAAGMAEKGTFRPGKSTARSLPFPLVNGVASGSVR